MARLLFMAFFLATVSAQAASAPASLVHELGRIPPASRVRVEVGGPGLLEGSLERWNAQSLWLRGPAEEKEIPLSSVQGLWVRGRGTGHGAKVGALISGIVGAVVGSATVALGRGLAEGGGPDGFRGNYFGMAAVGAVAGGAIGALAGAAVGSASPRWNRRFRQKL